MGATLGRRSCPYLDALIALLDEEARTRDRPRRPELGKAIDDLALQASLAGASALTLSMIEASRTMIHVGEMIVPPTLH